MKPIYISHITEYEKGWGSKPDGIVISNDLEKLKTYIEPYNKREKGSYELFWNYSLPVEVLCDDKDIDSLTFNEAGIIYYDGIHDIPFQLYEKYNEPK